MRYIGESCPYCGNEFTETDDIVVCPECATPHHRSCWFAHGECANAAHHGEGFVWQKTVQPEPEEPHAAPGKSLDIVCPDCGKVCPNGTLRCPDCGAILVPQFSPDGMPPLAQFRPEFNPNEDVGDLKSGDVALYCRTGGSRYIRVYKKMADGKKFTWNWGALFFAPYWFIYRKLYKVGIIFFALLIALSLWQAPFSAKFYDVYESVATEAQHAYDESENGSQDAYNAVIQSRAGELETAMKPLVAPYACTILLNVIAALIADRLYRKKMENDVKRIRSEGTDERTVQGEIFRTGGASLLAGLGSYAGLQLVLYLFSQLLSK